MMGERLDRDDFTLRQVKFSPTDAVIARKREAIPPPPPPPGTAVAVPVGQTVGRGLGTGSGGGGQGAGGKAMKAAGPLADDLITPPDLADDLLALLQPLHWLGTTVSDYESTTSTVAATPTAETPATTGGLALASMPSRVSDVTSVSGIQSPPHPSLRLLPPFNPSYNHINSPSNPLNNPLTLLPLLLPLLYPTTTRRAPLPLSFSCLPPHCAANST